MLDQQEGRGDGNTQVEQPHQRMVRRNKYRRLAYARWHSPPRMRKNQSSSGGGATEGLRGIIGGSFLSRCGGHWLAGGARRGMAAASLACVALPLPFPQAERQREPAPACR